MPEKNENKPRPQKSVNVKKEEPLENVFEAVPTEKVEKNVYGIVSAELLNVRNKTSKDHGAVIAVISKGTRVMILEELENWYKIKFNDKVGFCVKEFINK